MSLKRSFENQYNASLAMLSKCVELGVDGGLWDDAACRNRFWRIVYHTLFYADFYLSPDMKSFTPWARHREEYQFLGRVPWPPHHEPRIGEPYAPADLLEYASHIAGLVPRRLASYALEDPCGFPWLDFNKCEMLIYNLRHMDYHAAQLAGRIRAGKGVTIEWIGRLH